MTRRKVGSIVLTKIILNCRQIHQEALAVLCRTRIAKFVYTAWQPRRAYVKFPVNSRVLQFRKLNFVARCTKPLHSFDYIQMNESQGEKSTMGHMLHFWATALIKRALQGTSIPRREIRLTFQLGAVIDFDIGTEPWKARYRRNLWYHVQAESAVEKMREDLFRRLTSIVVVLTSNVDTDEEMPVIDVERVDAELVRFSCGEKK